MATSAVRGVSLPALRLALQMAVTDLEEGHALDPFRFADYDWQQEQFLERLRRQLTTGTYRPKPLLELTFPKSEFAVRPGRRIELDDLVVVYFALMAIAGDLEQRLRAGVTAYRLTKRRPPDIVLRSTYLLPKYLRRRLRFVDPWYNAWPTFRKRLQREWTNQGRRFLGVTDITSFYEDIDLAILREVLRNRVRTANRGAVNLLIEMYEAWSARDVHRIPQNRGLPQGTNSSGPIANYFLMPIDEWVELFARRRQLRWYRYSDDARLVGKTRESVRLGLRGVGQELGRLNLIQNSAKTRVLTGREAKDAIFDQRGEKIAQIREDAEKTKLTRRGRDARVRRLDRIHAEIRSKSVRTHTDSTNLAQLYGAYGRLNSDRLLRFWRKDYLAEPPRIHTILGYVSPFLVRPGRRRELIETIGEQRQRATDWELAELLRALRRVPSLPDRARALLRSIAFSRNANWYVRQQALVSLGWFRLNSEVSAAFRYFEAEWDDEVRRATATLCFMRTPADENAFLAAAATSMIPKVARMANFLLALRADPELALFNLRKFRSANAIFVVDNYWRLYQIARNPDPAVQRSLASRLHDVISAMGGRHVNAHVKALRQLML